MIQNRNERRRSEEIVPDDPDQYQRFIEAAHELGADTPEAVEASDQALRRMLPPREPGKPVHRRMSEPRPKRAYRKKYLP